MPAMHRRGKRLVSLLALQGFMLVLAACGGWAGLETEILGKWIGTEGQPEQAVYFEFFKDGTVILEYTGRDEKQSLNVVVGTYSVLDSTRIKMQITSARILDLLEKPSGPTRVLSISISGNDATLVDLDGGATIKLKRINSK